MNDIEKRARDIADVLPAQVDAGAWPNGYGDGWNDCARIAHEEILPAIIAALSAAPQVPEGWVLVPVEPTEEMIWGARDVKVGGHCYVCSKDDASEDDARGVWSAMLAAIPGVSHG